MTLLALSRIYFVALLVSVLFGLCMVLWLRFKTQAYKFHDKVYKIQLWEEIFKEKKKKLYMLGGLVLVNIASLMLMNAIPLKYVVVAYIGAILLAMLVVLWYNMEYSVDFKALYTKFLKIIFSIPILPYLVVKTAFELKRSEPNMAKSSIAEVILLMNLQDIREIILKIDDTEDKEALQELHYLIYVLIVYANIHYPYLKHDEYGGFFKMKPTKSMSYMFHVRGLQVFDMADFNAIVNLRISTEEIYVLLESAKYRQYVLQTEVWRNGADMDSQRIQYHLKPIEFYGYNYHIRSQAIPLEAFRAYTISLQEMLEGIVANNMSLMILLALSKRDFTQLRQVSEILKLAEQPRYKRIERHICGLTEVDDLFKELDAWLGHFLKQEAIQECVGTVLKRKHSVNLRYLGENINFPQFFTYAILIATYADNYYGEYIPVELDNILYIQHVIEEQYVV